MLAKGGICILENTFDNLTEPLIEAKTVVMSWTMLDWSHSIRLTLDLRLNLEAVRMDQSIKCLPYKNEDPSLDPQHRGVESGCV